MRRLWRAVELLAWTAFFAFAALVLALRFWVLPDVERYRPDIVAAATRALGVPVKIGTIDAGWLGLRPQVNLYDVRIQDAQGRDALVLPVIENVLAWRSLLAGGLRLHSVAIEGLKLGVRRDASGALYVAGVKVSGGGGGSDQRLADWVLDQSEIVVRNAEVEWIDEKRGAPPLALSDVNFRLRNAGSRHAIGLTARPPAALGSGLELRAELSGRSAADLAEWNGRAFVELGYTDLAGWRAWVDYPLVLQRGQGALRLWATVAGGEPTGATADVQLTGVEAKLGPDLPPLELAALSGRLQAASRKGGYELNGRQLALRMERGPAIEPSDFHVEWTPQATQIGAAPERGMASAKLIDLEPLARLAETLPFPADLRKLLADLAPRGRLLDARFEWTGKLPEPAKLTARARFADLAINAREDAPGFSGVAGSIEADETRGSLQLDARKAELALPRVLSEPRLPLDTLSGRIDWERKGERAFTLHATSLAFANEDLEGKASGSYTYSGEGPGTIDLSASLTRASAARLPRYLPTKAIMGAALHDYLAGAVLGGESRDTRVRLKGDLRDFPFVDRTKGEFQVSVRVQKGAYEYVSGWPRVYDIDAELLFERDRMEILARSASILGAKAANVRVAIPAMLAPQVRIEVNGQAEGPTSEFMKYIESSPVQAMIGGATEGMIAVGRGKLHLKLDVPLDKPETTRLAGDFEFIANSLIVSAKLPPIERATGRLSFTDSGFTVHEVTGRVFGGPITVGGGTRRDKAIEITAKGDAQVGALGPLLDHPWRRHLAGAAAYTAAIIVRDGRFRVNVDSPLRGVASDLPPPFAKRAPDTLRLHVEYLPFESGARDSITVTLGQLAVGEVLRRRQGDAMTVQRTSIWLSPKAGEPPRLPERTGTLIYGSLASFDLDRWRPYLDEADAVDTHAPAQRQVTAQPKALSVEVKVGTLDVLGKRVHGVTARAGADAAGWDATVQSDEVTGELSYRNAGAGLLVARLTSLRVPEDYPGAPGGERTEDKQPPALDLIAERFIYQDKNFGRVEIKAERVDHDWRVNKLEMANPEASLKGTLVWRAAAPARTSINFDLDATDAGGFLARLGYAGLVLGGKARMQAAVSWNGDPNEVDYASLTGDLQLQADDGQFLKIDTPGLGKLISLMSLQSIPRRLSFDFRDLFEKGFAFDKIRAAGHIDNGLMTLKDFAMEGPSAQVEMTGQVDLAKETQNVKLRVVPSLGDTASAALVFINPLLIFPAAIAQRILRDPLGHIFAFNYTVTGSWGEPDVAKGRVEAQPVAPAQNP
jgi:uncharacterized protein (TIGR02099 family)